MNRFGKYRPKFSSLPAYLYPMTESPMRPRTTERNISLAAHLQTTLASSYSCGSELWHLVHRTDGPARRRSGGVLTLARH